MPLFHKCKLEWIWTLVWMGRQFVLFWAPCVWTISINLSNHYKLILCNESIFFNLSVRFTSILQWPQLYWQNLHPLGLYLRFNYQDGLTTTVGQRWPNGCVIQRLWLQYALNVGQEQRQWLWDLDLAKRTKIRSMITTYDLGSKAIPINRNFLRKVLI